MTRRNTGCIRSRGRHSVKKKRYYFYCFKKKFIVNTLNEWPNQTFFTIKHALIFFVILFFTLRRFWKWTSVVIASFKNIKSAWIILVQSRFEVPSNKIVQWIKIYWLGWPHFRRSATEPFFGNVWLKDRRANGSIVYATRSVTVGFVSFWVVSCLPHVFQTWKQVKRFLILLASQSWLYLKDNKNKSIMVFFF